MIDKIKAEILMTKVEIDRLANSEKCIKQTMKISEKELKGAERERRYQEYKVKLLKKELHEMERGEEI